MSVDRGEGNTWQTSRYREPAGDLSPAPWLSSPSPPLPSRPAPLSSPRCRSFAIQSECPCRVSSWTPSSGRRAWRPDWPGTCRAGGWQSQRGPTSGGRRRGRGGLQQTLQPRGGCSPSRGVWPGDSLYQFAAVILSTVVRGGHRWSMSAILRRGEGTEGRSTCETACRPTLSTSASSHSQTVALCKSHVFLSLSHCLTLSLSVVTTQFGTFYKFNRTCWEYLGYFPDVRMRFVFLLTRMRRVDWTNWMNINRINKIYSVSNWNVYSFDVLLFDKFCHPSLTDSTRFWFWLGNVVTRLIFSI